MMSRKLQVTVLLAGVMTLSGVVISCGENRSAAETELRVEVGPQQKKFVDAALWQIGKTTSYNPAYVGLEYPMGDIPIEKGVCTDVVIRAMRKAWKKDLQELVHKDMKANFSKYPKRWGLKSTDKNIDHRRVPNLRTYFKRQGWSLAVTDKKESFKPGDLVTCTVAGNRPHIMIVSDRMNEDGVPYVIHNIGGGTQEEDCLFTYPLTGHYRVK